MSFRHYIDGFKYCRPLINIDDIYLYERYDKKLLIAVVFNVNNKIFPWFFPLV